METTMATEAAIARAAERLRAGQLVAFPTETVYGLGADATKANAVAEIYATKERPRFNPLIVHVRDMAHAEQYAAFHRPARDLAAQFWPGPLTLVLPRRAGCGIADLVTAGLDTIALRAPGHLLAQALLRAAALPLAAPSANRSGRVSPTLAQHVAEDFAEHEGLILDGGPCAIGLESTVIGWMGDEAVLLRPGALARDAVEAALGQTLQDVMPGEALQSPGQLASHYAPRAQLRLDAVGAEDGEALLTFGADAPAGHFNLSATGDLVEAAANLFAALRLLDATAVGTIAVTPIPAHGLGEAINDRLRRAATLR